MSTNASYVSVGKPKVSGAVFRAPAGTTLPTTAMEPLNEAFKDMGYISDEGWVNSKSRESAEVKAWGGDTVLQPQTSKTDTFKMTFIESLNPEVIKAIQGDDNVEGDLASGLTVRENSQELPEAVWVIDTVMTGGVIKRTVIPKGQITETGDVTHKDDEPVGYEVTITAFPFADYDGDSHRELYIGGSEGGSDEGGDEQTLGELTVVSVAGAESGTTALSVSPAKDADNIYKIKLAEEEAAVEYDTNVQNWTPWDGEADIEAEANQVITVVEATSDYKARKAGSAVVTVNA